jgi:hypothetical protein
MAMRLVAMQCYGRCLQLGWLIANAIHVGSVNCCMSRVVLRLHRALNILQIQSGTVDKEWSSILGGKLTIVHSVSPACFKLLHMDSQSTSDGLL